MQRRVLALAIAIAALLSIPSIVPVAAQAACDPENGIGPDGGLPALPPPTEAGATFVDLAQAAAPVDMALDTDTGLLHVVERGANDVVVIDARADAPTIVGSSKVGERPTALALDQASHRLFVANGASCSVTVLDVSEPTPKVLGTLAAASGPRGVAVDPASGQAWTANWKGDAISLIDGRGDPPSLVGDPVSVGPGHVAAAADGSLSRIVLIGDAGLQAFDSATGQAAGPAISLPGGVDVTTDDAGTAWVAQAGSGKVSRIELAGETPALTATSDSVAVEPFDVRFVPGIDRVVVPSRAGEVLFLDPATLQVGERVSSSPALAAALVDEATGRLWMLDYTYHRVWSVPIDEIVAAGVGL
jgi:DNA-binding beta-propeller fold protein YncE